MKVDIHEVRKTIFIDFQDSTPQVKIEISYKVYIGGKCQKSFSSKEGANAYIKYLEEEKKDYQKVIKEIEI
jgi:hypothetical protein